MIDLETFFHNKQNRRNVEILGNGAKVTDFWAKAVSCWNLLGQTIQEKDCLRIYMIQFKKYDHQKVQNGRKREPTRLKQTEVLLKNRNRL